MAEKDYIDPNNERLQDAKAQGESNLKEYETSMNAAISSNNQAKNDALNEIGKMESNGKWTPGSATANLADAMNKQTDFAIEEIKQQKEQAKKDYIKEQSGAYTDWQKQSNAYGANAEAMASQGMQNSGYSESSQVSMYNQYQARITAAREAFVRISQDFDNNMTQARLQNNSALAQIYADAMAKRLEIATQFAFKNTELLTTLAQQKAAIKQQNFSNYLSVYNQLLDEQQHKDSLQLQRDSLQLQRDQFNWQKQKYEESKTTSSGGSGGSGTIKKTSSGGSSKTKKTKKASKQTKKIIENAIGGAASGKKTSEPTPDMASVLALGYGPISATKLNTLISQGLVEEYEKNGKLKYRRSKINRFQR